MSVKDEEFKTKIYDLMNSDYNLEEYPVAESSVVKDEFAEGNTAKSYIRRCWKRMRGYAEDLDCRTQKIRIWRLLYQIS